MAINWRPDLFGKPTLYHLTSAGLLTPNPAEEAGVYSTSAYDSQGRLVMEDPLTRELFTDGAPIGDEGVRERVPYDPVAELGVTALQQAGFLQMDQAAAAALPEIIRENNETSFMEQYGPAIMAAIPTLGGSIAAAGGIGNYVSGIGSSIANLPTTISNAVSNGASGLSDLLTGWNGAGVTEATGLEGMLEGMGAGGTGAGTGAGASSLANADGGSFWGDVSLAGAPSSTSLITEPATYSLLDPTMGASTFGGLGAGAGAGSMLGTGLKVAGVGAGAGAGAGAAGATGVGLGTAVTGASGLSSLKNILDNGGSVDDWLNIAGKAAPGLIGAFAANEQADAIRDVGGKEDARIREFMTFGAPSRERYEASFAPGFDITSDPALRGAMDTTTDTLLRRLSASGGNPYGNPGGLMEAEKYVMGNVALPYLQNYRNQNASTGGYGAFNTTAAGGGDTTKLNLAGINADAGMWGGLGDAASSVFTPRSSLDQLLKQLKGYGLGTSLA